jgi:hypothetical protein
MNKSTGSISPGPCHYDIPELASEAKNYVEIKDLVEVTNLYKKPPVKKLITPGPNYY